MVERQLPAPVACILRLRRRHPAPLCCERSGLVACGWVQTVWLWITTSLPVEICVANNTVEGHSPLGTGTRLGLDAYVCAHPFWPARCKSWWACAALRCCNGALRAAQGARVVQCIKGALGRSGKSRPREIMHLMTYSRARRTGSAVHSSYPSRLFPDRRSSKRANPYPQPSALQSLSNRAPLGQT